MQTGERYKQDQFARQIQYFDFGSTPPTRLVIHHTYNPKLDEWNGRPTYRGILNYYKRKGWEAYPHFFVAPDGVWCMSDPYEPGIHAGDGNATYKLPGGKLVKGYGWKYVPGAILHDYSLGIEIVGDYDKKRWSGKMKERALHTISTLRKKLDIDDKHIEFHRDYSTKSCPGDAITKDWLYQQLEVYENRTTPEPSDYAKQAWDWFIEEGFDKSLHPHQTMSAESIVTLLHNFKNKYLDE